MVCFILHSTIKYVRFCLVFLICCLNYSNHVQAQEQFIDKTFANSGIRLDSSFGASFYFLRSLVQTSGKIIVKANSKLGNNSYVFRFNANGIIDSTFGQNGILHLDTTFCRNMASDEDGNIFIDYEHPTIYYQYFISKINSSGKIDSTFGEKGKLIISKPSSTAYKTPILKNNNLYVFSYESNPSKEFISKFDLYGNKDTNFGQNGIFEIASTRSIYSQPNVEIDQMNNFYFLQTINDTTYCAKHDNTTKPDLKFGLNGLIRLTSDMYSAKIKILDSLGFFVIDNYSITRFFNSGEIDSNFRQFNLTLPLVSITELKKITDGYLVSTFKKYPTIEFTIYKMSVDGRLDSNSIINKKFEYDYEFHFTADNENIYYYNFTYPITKGSILSIEKFDLFGKYDSKFGISGKVEWMAGFGNSYGIFCQHLGNNEIFQLSITSPGSPGYGYVVAHKFNPKGILTKTFGDNGALVYEKGISFGNGNDFICEIDELGRLYYAGQRYNPHEDRYYQVLLRFLHNGNLDTSFINILLDYKNSKFVDGRITAFKRLNNKNILIAIDKLKFFPNLKLSLLDSNGVLIKNLELPTLMPRFEINIDQIQQAKNGQIYISGLLAESIAFKELKVHSYISSYDHDGKLDTTFGKNGMWISDHFTNEKYFSTSSNPLRITDQNDIFLLRNSFSDQRVYKVKASGISDSNFGHNGVIVDTITSQRRLYKFIVDEDNNTYLLKFYNSEILLTRYNSNGKLDSTYGINGNILIPLNNRMYYPTDFTIDNDNNIYITGTVDPATFTIKILNKIETSISKDKNTTFSSSVYPMPISRYFTLQLPQNFTEAIKINLLNANGQFIKTLHSNSVNLGQQEIKLDIGSKLNPGIYFLQINSSNHSEIIQIIIQ